MDLISQTSLRIAKVVWRPGHGGVVFTVICKATFELRPGSSPLAGPLQQTPVVENDVWAETGSLVAATDLTPFKKSPEVLLVGNVFAPQGQPVTSLVARLVVGEIDKSILVVGDRYVNPNGRASEPVPFARLPLVWERAAGGPGTENPAGRPTAQNARNLATELMAPNLYPNASGLPLPGAHVAPVNFAPTSPLWPSRLSCLHQHAIGWDPMRWHERPLPSDIDLAYFNAAPADQQQTAPFADEKLYLENLHPRFSHLSTQIDLVSPSVTVDQGSGPVPMKLRCDTLIIDTDRGLAMLVWRGHVPITHPESPGRVVVRDDSEVQVTSPIGLSLRAVQAAVLPFAKAATPPSFPPPSPPSENGMTQSTDDKNEEAIRTLIPGINLPAAPVLPFAPAQREPTPLRPPPMQPPPMQPSPMQPSLVQPEGERRSGVSAWMQLGVDNAAPNAGLGAPLLNTVAKEPKAPTPNPAEEAKSAPEPDGEEARLRIIQRAIWKGDRPIGQILAEHGLTEIEWRAAKRAATRKNTP